jgi:hypothetical protein
VADVFLALEAGGRATFLCVPEQLLFCGYVYCTSTIDLKKTHSNPTFVITRVTPTEFQDLKVGFHATHATFELCKQTTATGNNNRRAAVALTRQHFCIRLLF